MTLESGLLQAEVRCRQARSIHALAFSLVNETWQLHPYRQAQFWRKGAAGVELMAVSGLATLAEDSPFTVWARKVMRTLWPSLGDQLCYVDLATLEASGKPAPQLAALTPELIQGWEEWWPPHVLFVPLRADGQTLAVHLILLDEPPTKNVMSLFARLQSTWSYCAWALLNQRRVPLSQRLPRSRKGWLIAVAMLALLALPVRQSALAPGELVATHGFAVSAPLDGVIASFQVQPNQMVSAGALLFTLDDTTLRNRQEVAARSLEVAGAELLSAQQRAFDDSKARSEVATLQGRIAERRAELTAVQEQLQRMEVRAPRDGIAVFTDTNDWQGRPVSTGERIMQLADPNDVGVLLYLPVADAIALEEGARIRLFLHVSPLDPINATLTQTSYQSVLSPDGVASYRLRAKLVSEDDAASVSRIGLKGTAKVYGQKVSLAYYLMRRPLSALRQWSGL